MGYSCTRHSSFQQDTPLWSSGNQQETLLQSRGTNAKIDQRESGTPYVPSVHRGVKISSATALRALEEAQLLDAEASTAEPDDSVVGTASTQTTVENDNLRPATKHQGNKPNYSLILDDLRSRLRGPSQYIASLQELEERVWENSAITLYTPWKETFSNDEEKKDASYPPIPSELQDIIPNRLSDDPFTKDPTNTSDVEITLLCLSVEDPALSSHLNAIRVCRNIILRTFLNLKLLQKSNFGAGCFSIIVLDRNRRNVAKLLPIENTDFIAFMFELEYILRDSASLVLKSSRSKHPPDMDHQYEFLKTPMVNQYCLSLLQIEPEALPDTNLGIVRRHRLL